MPIEIRYLMFDEAEVTASLVGYDRRTRPQAASRVIVDMRLDDFPILKAFLTMRKVSGELDVVEFGGAQLAAALILHCRHKGIPLPARAAKSVRPFERGLCLSLSINAPPSLQTATMPEGISMASAAR